MNCQGDLRTAPARVGKNGGVGVWKVGTVIGAAAVAAAVIVANLVPANARPAGPGAATAHPQTVQHRVTGGRIDPCNLPFCKEGNSGAIAGPAGPSLANARPPLTKHPTTGAGSKPPCKDDEPICHHHHEHNGFDNNHAYFVSNGLDVYQPEPDCWRWSYKRHHWIWVCGPPYPTY
jgi:hypothetical protein